MKINNHYSGFVSNFHTPELPENGAVLAGYIALIDKYNLPVPRPDAIFAIGKRHKKYEKGFWHLLTPRHAPEDTLHGHLVFALRNEGVNLLVLKALFKTIGKDAITEMVHAEPTGSYSRKLWFLYEWLMGETLTLENVTRGNFVDLINDTLQYPGPSRRSRRHRVNNNLPGLKEFCPLIRKTKKLKDFLNADLSSAAKDQIGHTHANLLSRAAAFLLLKDSKASYSIEGESPNHTRVERWGKIIGQAGQRALSTEELEYLQSIVIADNRFTTLGLRTEGGFVGDHDRSTSMPLPAHISARFEDLESLISGLIRTNDLLRESNFDAVLQAAMIAFGFVFIHPFEDGNGRLHRYLMHHVLAEKSFIPKGLVFPVSAVMLERIEDYQHILEHYSKPLLNLIQWQPTDKGNIEVLNETIDYYRYFDVTRQAEFLFECVESTVKTTLPEEIDYLLKFDQLNEFIKNYIDMPDKTVTLLIRILDNSKGILSKRKRSKEFNLLTDREVDTIERKYKEIFSSD